MNIENVKKEIANSSFGIEYDELKKENQIYNTCFSSIEYHLIIYLSNQDLYYTDGETLKLYEDGADDIEDTPNGRIFLMK